MTPQEQIDLLRAELLKALDMLRGAVRYGTRGLVGFDPESHLGIASIKKALRLTEPKP